MTENALITNADMVFDEKQVNLIKENIKLREELGYD